MKLKKTLIVREVAGEYILIPFGEAVTEYNGVFTVSPVAAFAIELMKEEIEKDELINKILEEFDVDRETAERDLDTFISQLEDLKIL